MRSQFNAIIFSILLLSTLGACKKNFLDRAATTQQQDADIFTNFATTDMVVNNLYSRIRGAYVYCGGYSMSSATDEAKDASSWMASQNFNNGSWSGSLNPIGNTWRDSYVAIRQANTILTNIVKYKTPDDANNPGFLENRVGEVYFLRAWYLSELIRQFGGAIIVTDIIDQDDKVALNKPRNKYDECVAQILSDCEEAYKRVQFAYPANQVGRVTKGACLALKSRVLLYAASPLWAIAGKNGFQADITSGAAATDPEKWRKAADAAKAVIDLKDGSNAIVYQLEPTLADRQKMFTSTTLQSREVIFERMRETNQDYDKYMFPYGSNGWSGCAPTQNIVDDYEMKNGLPITDPASGYDAARPYINRDPRFYKDITYNGATFKNRKIETFTGGKDEQSTATDHTRTGYYCRKLVDESITANQGSSTRLVHGVIFRLSEFYLSYAEALNEYDPGNADILTYVNFIRQRAGQPVIPAGLNQQQMRQRIRNERRIELAFENHRFWDVRRWKIAENTEKSMYGMKAIVDAAAPDGFRYERFKVEDRLWRNAMYVIPLPVDETLRNVNMVQNAGW
ncbi:RagB/SusD family nutrient uptake outer membrane protein [Chitinophaga eiseniae]|uniref:RagB/SusD family nutrient uptake outer membrane protein n=1 Tax=Chitinophaga eiseniae TaxID=634771 RepID=A0A847SNR8_9BACT|nr:RagB/SusD family nutrient uptake outer membrane protein [Chitinophaga eiseniae]NLR79478.1 RagB/SusD family nutrient uptake outer membrane protein [Chitinophaga eiseniae]